MGPFRERLTDRAQRTIHIEQHQFRRKPKCSNALAQQPGIPLFVSFRLITEPMAFAVNLNA
jgi:hypothetical protein